MVSVSSGGARTLSVRNHDRDLAGLTYVYPVLSRRAGGVSVGINLNPNNACNWHCVYCQVPDLVRGKAPAIDLARLGTELRGFLDDLVYGDWMQRFVPEGAREIRDIAFSGNGEPTSAAEFPQAVDLALRLREEFDLAGAGKAAAAVPLRLITNGSLMTQARVQDGIRRLGEAGGEVWFKIDGGTAAAIERINGVNLDPEAVVRHLACCTALCTTWVQTCMFRWDGEAPSAADIDAYLEVLARGRSAGLAGVLLYGVARKSMQPEAARITPLTADELECIGERIKEKGLTVRVSP